MANLTISSLAASSAGDADREGTGGHFGPQVTAIAFHVTVELVRVGLPETHFDLSGLPLIDAVIGTRAPSDQPEECA